MATRKTVASMDDAEREYKRYNDRINQQYSRARKRRRLEDLQTQNKKLTAELEAAKAEIDGFRRRESAVRNALQWVSAVINEPASASVEGKECEKALSATFPPLQSSSVPVTALPTSEIQVSQQEPEFLDQTVPSPATQPDTSYGLEMLVSHPQQLLMQGEQSNTFDGLADNWVLNLPTDFGDGAWVNLLSSDMWPMATSYNTELTPITPEESPPGLPNAYMSSDQTDQSLSSGLADTTDQSLAWSELPLNVAATTDLDKVLLNVIALGRQWKSRQGDYHSELSHPSFPSIASLLNRDVEMDRSNNPLAAAIAKYTITTPRLNFPRKVAFHYTVALLLRWLVNPTEQSFAQLPEFLRPTVVQKTIPHPAWIDTVPWPQARDRIIRNLDIFDYELFKKVTQHSSINWPHSERDIFIAKQGSKQMMLNPRFVRHILNLNNWTNSPALSLPVGQQGRRRGRINGPVESARPGRLNYIKGVEAANECLHVLTVSGPYALVDELSQKAGLTGILSPMELSIISLIGCADMIANSNGLCTKNRCSCANIV